MNPSSMTAILYWTISPHQEREGVQCWGEGRRLELRGKALEISRWQPSCLFTAVESRNQIAAFSNLYRKQLPSKVV